MDEEEILKGKILERIKSEINENELIEFKAYFKNPNKIAQTIVSFYNASLMTKQQFYLIFGIRDRQDLIKDGKSEEQLKDLRLRYIPLKDFLQESKLRDAEEFQKRFNDLLNKHIDPPTIGTSLKLDTIDLADILGLRGSCQLFYVKIASSGTAGPSIYRDDNTVLIRKSGECRTATHAEIIELTHIVANAQRSGEPQIEHQDKGIAENLQHIEDQLTEIKSTQKKQLKSPRKRKVNRRFFKVLVLILLPFIPLALIMAPPPSPDVDLNVIGWILEGIILSIYIVYVIQSKSKKPKVILKIVGNIYVIIAPVLAFVWGTSIHDKNLQLFGQISTGIIWAIYLLYFIVIPFSIAYMQYRKERIKARIEAQKTREHHVLYPLKKYIVRRLQEYFGYNSGESP